MKEMPPHDAALPMRIDRYELHDVIASGGMATVHVGRLVGPARFGRTVAIKRLHPHLATQIEFVAMLTDEARVTGRIGHPNIVPTLDVVALHGELFLVMEYVTGLTLAALARNAAERGERIPIPVACAIMAGVLRGLDAAHDAHDEHGHPLDVVHRDVSPQNIIVGADGVPRLLDFGVAKAAGRLQTTRDGQLKGKLGYMAPEQLGARAVDRRTDVYAAAVVLWEALAGERLFRADDDVGTFGNILQKKVPPPSSRRSDVAPELDVVVLRGLEREPSRRFARARDMANAIESAAPLARASEIAHWVGELGEIELAERAKMVAGMTRAGAASAERSAPANDSALPPDSRRNEALTGVLTIVGDAREASTERRRNTLRRAAVVALGLGAASWFAIQRGAMKSVAATEIANAGVPAAAVESNAPLGENVSTGGGVAAAGPEPTLGALPSAGSAERSTDVVERPSSIAPASAKTQTVRSQSAKTQPTPRAGAAAHTSPTKARSAKAAACDPPFTIDEMGHKHYKVDCL